MRAAPAAFELAYRARTHQNAGRCRVRLFAGGGQPTVAVVEDVDGHIGPGITQASRAVAFALQREIGRDGLPWLHVEHRRDGSYWRVSFREALEGWFDGPRWTRIAAGSDAEAAGLAVRLDVAPIG